MLRFNRLPAVDARINGRGPYRLIVDTGAAGVVLRSDLAKELGLKSPPGMTGSAVQVKLKSPGNKNIPATLVHIDNLTLGGAEFQGVWTVATELPFGDDLHGVIGMNVFHECLLTYDYPGNRIRLAQGSLPAANGRDIIPFTTPGNSGSHPVIEVEVGGESARFLIDTGMRGWFALPLDRAKRIGMEAGPVAGPKALFVGGSSRRQVARLGANIEFGQYVVEHPTVFLTDENTGASLGTGMVLGTSVLEHFVVTFDIRNSVVRLTRSSSTPITVPAIRVLGISLRKRNQYMEVWDVHPASQAKSLAIAEGGIVHEINGQPAETLYGTIEWDDLLESADTVTLKYSPNATTPPRTLEVQVLELLPGVG
jgi:predicted aspartyl protease